jgi:hypothetical protein
MQVTPHDQVAFGFTWCVAALAVPAAVRPSAVVTATPAASPYSALLTRLRMGKSFLSFAGADCLPPLAWAVKLGVGTG